MTYQSNVNIKDEPFSPSTPNVILAVTGSRPASRTTPSAGSPAKRLKSESESVPTSTLETKKKLQDAVLDRRKAKGFTDLPNILFEEPKDCKLTKEDLDRREKRKEQNRKAAKKCRAKKKELQDKAEQETAQYVESNEKMQKIVLTMYQRLCTLAMYLSQHLNCGDCRISVDAQEEHKQFICRTEKFLPSCVLEGHKQQCHLAAANINPDDTSQLPDIIHNSYTSNGEAVSPVNDVVVAHDLGTNVSSWYESGNLPSWDLDNINPDIPHNVISSLSTDESLARAVGIANTSFAELPGDIQNQFTQAPDEYMSTLAGDIFPQEPAITAESTCPHDDLTDACHNNVGIYADLRLATYSNDSVSSYPEVSHFSISPNLVQPNLLHVQSVKSLNIPAAIQRGIGSCNQNLTNGQQARQQSYITLDFNNNKQSQNPAVQIEKQFSAYVDHSGVGNVPPGYYPSPYRSPEPDFFTFELDHTSAKDMDVPGMEPISPFYTEGGGQRV